MLSVTLRQITYACAIARHGGLTAAAQVLHVSQPALSVALNQIEHLLGQPLFLRRPGGPMTPTQFGRGWLEAAQTQLDAVARLMTGHGRPAPLRLGVFEDLAPLILAPLLATGRAVTPQVMGFDPLTEALIQGRADVAITWDLGLPPQMRRHIAAHLPPQAVLSASHRLADRATLMLHDLANEPLVLTNQGQSIDHMRGLFARRGLTPHIAHRCPSLDLMRSYAANGLGIGISYSQPAPRVSADGAPLVVIPLSDAGQEPVVLVVPEAAPDPTALADLLAMLAKLLQP